MNDAAPTLRTPLDRLRHALLFEIIGLLLVSPVASWITGHGLAEVGLLTFLISIIAMVWNGVFNTLFDRVEIRLGGHLSRRTLAVRILHATLFELGLAVMTVPLIAAYLGMGWWEALVLDIGFVLFYLVYALVFNWAYDRVFPLAEQRS